MPSKKPELIARDFDEWAKMAENATLAAFAENSEGKIYTDIRKASQLRTSIKILCRAYHDLMSSASAEERKKWEFEAESGTEISAIREAMLANYEELVAARKRTQELFDKLGVKVEEDE